MGITLVDDSSKFTRNQQAGQQPPRDTDLSINDPESVLRLLDARLRLTSRVVNGGGVFFDKASTPALAARPASLREAIEYTPTPMVIEEATESESHRVTVSHGFNRATRASREPEVTRPMPVVERFSGNASLSGMALPDERITEPSTSYHPPRRPPESVAPPVPASSFSVAPEYDPRAPTKPRVRRVSTRPPAPLFFGLDRMLVWGMVLGGVFVAAIVVLVHRLAPSRQVGVEQKEWLSHTKEPSSAKTLPKTVSKIDLALPLGTAVPSAKPLGSDDEGKANRRGVPSSSVSVRVRTTASPQVNKTVPGKASPLWIE